MIEIPDSLRSLFTSTVEERADRYVIEVPKHEIDHEAIQSGGRYRVALLDAPDAPRQGSREPVGTQQRQTSANQEKRDRERGPPTPPVDEGEVREVTIESIGDQGDGIAKVERGYVVIVPDARPGEQPIVEIEAVQQNVAFARVVDDAHSAR